MKVAVIGGGWSNERDVSLKTGEQIFGNLSDKKYEKSFVEISQDGRWLLHKNYPQLDSADLSNTLTIMNSEKGISKNDLQQFDVLFLALHGKYGEDGKIQSILDILNITYTGSGVLPSALGMNKAKTIEFVENLCIKVPKCFLLYNNKYDVESLKSRVDDKINYPCIVKPNESGSSIGISKVEEFDELETAVNAAFNEDNTVMVEEFIDGKEITCGVLGNANQTELQALPPVEIIAENTFFDYDAKYFSEKTQEICPAEISEEQTLRVQNYSKKIHETFGCDGVTRSDFILKDNEYYFLEINTLPGMTEASLCPKEASAAGMKFGEFLDKIVNLAIRKNE